MSRDAVIAASLKARTGSRTLNRGKSTQWGDIMTSEAFMTLYNLPRFS